MAGKRFKKYIFNNSSLANLLCTLCLSLLHLGMLIDILINIIKCLFIFYVTFYAIGSIIFAVFGQSNFDGKIPFDFKTWIDLSKCCKEYQSVELVNFTTMAVTFFICGAIYGIVIRSRVWDYAITVTVFHALLSSLVMLDFPLSWSWWVCLGCGLVIMTLVGEGVAFGIRKRSKNRVITPDPMSTSTSYLYKKPSR